MFRSRGQNDRDRLAPKHGDEHLLEAVEGEGLRQHRLPGDRATARDAPRDVAGDEHRACREPRPIATKDLVQGGAIHPRHAQVADDRVHARLLERGQCGVAIADGDDSEAAKRGKALQSRAKEGKTREATALYEEVVRRWPRSDEAVLAREALRAR